jgi:ankyrin repeat protein
MNSNKNDDLSKKFISDDKFLKSNQFADSMDTETIMKLLKEKPYLLNQPQEKFGFTLLYIAVVNKNYNLCEFLLENNADPNLKNIYGETPLHQAIEIENNKIINLLLEKGADPNATNNVIFI